MPLGNLKNVLGNFKILKRAGQFKNPENALGPSRNCPKSWNGPTISRWLGRFIQDPENAHGQSRDRPKSWKCAQHIHSWKLENIVQNILTAFDGLYHTENHNSCRSLILYHYIWHEKFNIIFGPPVKCGIQQMCKLWNFSGERFRILHVDCILY